MNTPYSMAPALQLPSAFIQGWPESGVASSPFPASVEGLGIHRIHPYLLAIHPFAGRGEVFDSALDLALRLAQGPGLETGKTPGLLVFPGVLRLPGGPAQPLPNPLSTDLQKRGPVLAKGKVYVTGYVAAWISGRYHLGAEKTYAAPSGRRTPIFEVLGLNRELNPWHNHTVLGHRTRIPRPRLEAELSRVLSGPIAKIDGPLGSGKTFAVWHGLPEPKQWIGLGRARVGTPELGLEVHRTLSLWLGDPRAVSVPQQATPESWEAHLCRAAEQAHAHLRERPSLVVDNVHLASGADEALMGHLIAGDFSRWCRLVLVGRSFDSQQPPSELPPDLPLLRVPAMGREDMLSLFGPQLESMDLSAKVRDRFLDASAGLPFAMEEGLVRLLHQGKVRSVYGSYFYAGDDRQPFEASERLVRHVDAESGRLGSPLAIRILSVVDHGVAAGHVARAADRLDIEVDGDWFQPYIEAGWLHIDDETRLRFAVPALSQALRQTLSDQDRGRLRHALGSSLASGAQEEEKWAAYRLMAGSPEALPPLLEFSRVSSARASTREEVFYALLSEHKEARLRQASPEIELQILWVLLPMARRLGKLAAVDQELTRGVELAKGDGQKWVALVALRAELDMERGDYRKAEAGLREALTASKGSGRQRRATLFIRLGALLQREGRYDEAQQVFEQLLAVVDKSGPTPLGATCRHYLGAIALLQKRLDEARGLLQQAVDYRLEHDLHKPLAGSLSALGTVALTEGDYPSALEYFAAAEGAFADAGAQPWELAGVYTGKGRTLGLLGDITRGTKPLRMALDIYQQRGEVAAAAEARLHLATNLLAFDQTPAALEEVRKAHFQLSLMDETPLLGDAERLLGRALLAQNDSDAAGSHLQLALRIHLAQGTEQDLVEDHSWLVAWAMGAEQEEAVMTHAAELRDLLQGLHMPARAEQLDFTLYQAFSWLERRGYSTPDPLMYLRDAYRELMRKTSFLAPDQRHAFLYQVRAHQAILDQAAAHQISLPVLTSVPAYRAEPPPQ